MTRQSFGTFRQVDEESLRPGVLILPGLFFEYDILNKEIHTRCFREEVEHDRLAKAIL